jgi:hypothetical protein
MPKTTVVAAPLVSAARHVPAGVFLVVVQLARIPFSASTTWHAITNWLLHIGG